MGGHAQDIGKSLFTRLMRFTRRMQGTSSGKAKLAIKICIGQALFSQKVKDIGRFHILLSWACHKDTSVFLWTIPKVKL